MPTRVNIPEVGAVNFPDSMTTDEIQAACQRIAAGGAAAAPAPVAAPAGDVPPTPSQPGLLQRVGQGVREAAGMMVEPLGQSVVRETGRRPPPTWSEIMQTEFGGLPGAVVEPLQDTPLRFLHPVAKAAGEWGVRTVGGLLDFVTSPTGALLTMAGASPAARALLHKPSVQAGVGAGFTTSMAPQALESGGQAVAEPSAESLTPAVLDILLAALPAAGAAAATAGRGRITSPRLALMQARQAARAAESERLAGQGAEAARPSTGAESGRAMMEAAVEAERGGPVPKGPKSARESAEVLATGRPFEERTLVPEPAAAPKRGPTAEEVAEATTGRAALAAAMKETAMRERAAAARRKKFLEERAAEVEQARLEAEREVQVALERREAARPILERVVEATERGKPAMVAPEAEAQIGSTPPRPQRPAEAPAAVRGIPGGQPAPAEGTPGTGRPVAGGPGQAAAKPIAKPSVAPQGVKAAEAAARKRIAERGPANLGEFLREESGTFDPQALADFVMVGAGKIRRGARLFRNWSEQMVAEYGEEIRPHLLKIYQRAERHFEEAPPLVSPGAEPSRGRITEVVRERMRGGAQSAMVRADDGGLYIVKSVQNAQHPDVVVREYVAGRIMYELGLPVGEPAILEHTGKPPLEVRYGERTIGVKPGKVVGIPVLGEPGMAQEFLPDALLMSESARGVRDAFRYALPVDVWLGNLDGRQGVMLREGRRWVARLIDQGYALGGFEGDFSAREPAYGGAYHRPGVYGGVRSLEDFEPILGRVERFPDATLRRIADAVPDEWVGSMGGRENLNRTVEVLIDRKGTLREMLVGQIERRRANVPNWEGATPRKSISPQRTPTQGRLFELAEEAMGRIRERGKARIKDLLNEESGTFDPQALADYVVVGAAKIARGTKEFSAWSKEMVKDFGESIRPHLLRLYARAKDYEAQGGLFEPAVGEAGAAAARRAAEIEGARLTAQFKAPVTAEEARAKLKKAPPPSQGSLFGEPEAPPAQQSLFNLHEAAREQFGEKAAREQRSFWDDETGTMDFSGLARWWRHSTARQLARDVGEEARPEISRIRRAGAGAGKNLADILERATENGELDAGENIVRLMDAGLRKLSHEEALSLVDALEGRAKPMNDRVRQVFEAARSMTDKIRDQAVDLGVEQRSEQGDLFFGGRTNYYPHLIRSPEILAKPFGKVRRDVLANLVRIGAAKTPGEARLMLDEWIEYAQNPGHAGPMRTVEYLVRNGFAKNQAAALEQLRRAQTHYKRYGSLENRREVNLPFWDPDPRRVLPTHGVSAAMRLAQVEEFGQHSEAIAVELLKIQKAGGNAREVGAAVDRIIGKVAEADTSGERLSRLAAASQVVKLTLAAIPNSAQWLLSWLAADLPSVAVGMKELFTARGRRFALHSGASMEQILREATREMGGGDWAKRYLKAVGFTPTEWVDRVGASNIGAAFARRTFKRLAKDPKDVEARALLDQLGVDVDSALRRGALSPLDLRRAGLRTSNRTQFRNRPQDIPRIASASPWGRLWWVFRNYNYQALRLSWDASIGEFKAGRPKRAIRNIILMSVLFPAIGDQVRALRDAILGRERKDESLFERWLWGAANVSTFGQITDLMRSGTIGAFGESLAGTFLASVGRLGSAALRPAKTEGARAKRFGRQVVKEGPYGSVLAERLLKEPKAPKRTPVIR